LEEFELPYPNNADNNLWNPKKKTIHIKPKNVAAGVARRNIFGFYYFLQVP
jgi:hypothetical protein